MIIVISMTKINYLTVYKLICGRTKRADHLLSKLVSKVLNLDLKKKKTNWEDAEIINCSFIQILSCKKWVKKKWFQSHVTSIHAGVILQSMCVCVCARVQWVILLHLVEQNFLLSVVDRTGINYLIVVLFSYKKIQCNIYFIFFIWQK